MTSVLSSYIDFIHFPFFYYQQRDSRSSGFRVGTLEADCLGLKTGSIAC